MSETHTPGPWRVRGGAASVYAFDIVGPKGEDIGYANQSDGADDPEVYPDGANARLMAAAPDLLAACRAFLAADPGEGYSPLEEAAIDLMRAAIAKAEGAV